MDSSAVARAQPAPPVFEICHRRRWSPVVLAPGAGRVSRHPPMAGLPRRGCVRAPAGLRLMPGRPAWRCSAAASWTAGCSPISEPLACAGQSHSVPGWRQDHWLVCSPQAAACRQKLLSEGLCDHWPDALTQEEQGKAIPGPPYTVCETRSQCQPASSLGQALSQEKNPASERKAGTPKCPLGVEVSSWQIQTPRGLRLRLLLHKPV